MTFNISKINEQLYILKIYLILALFLFTAVTFNEDIVSARYNIKLLTFIDTLLIRDIILSAILLILTYNFFFLLKLLERKKIILILLAFFISILLSLKFIFLNEYRLFLSNSLILTLILVLYLNPNNKTFSHNSLIKFCYFLTTILSFIAVISLFDFERQKYDPFQTVIFNNFPIEIAFEIVFPFFKWFDSTAIRNPLYLIILLSIVFNFYIFFEKRKFSIYLKFLTLCNIYYIFDQNHFISQVILVIILTTLFFKYYNILFSYININRKHILFFYLIIFLSSFIYTKTSLIVLKKVFLTYDYLKYEFVLKKYSERKKCYKKYPFDYEYTGEIRKILTFDKKQCYGNRYPIDDTLFFLSSFAQRTLMLENYLKTINFQSFIFGIDARSYVFLTKSIAPQDYPPTIRSSLAKTSYTHNSYSNLFFRYGFLITLITFVLLYKETSKNKNNFYFLLAFFLVFFSQCFDDYLFGNRIETTLLIWTMLSLTKIMIKQQN